MQDGRKAVWSIPDVSGAFFPRCLKQNFIEYRSSKVSDRIFETHQLWQSGFSRVYSNCCCSCSFEPEIIKIDQSSHKMHSNGILNFQVSMAILKAQRKKSGNLSYASRILVFITGNFRFSQSNLVTWQIIQCRVRYNNLMKIEFKTNSKVSLKANVKTWIDSSMFCPTLCYIRTKVRIKWVHAYSKGFSQMWKANNLVQDLNHGQPIRSVRQISH